MLLGAIADDFTGASDLANTLARNGMATTLFVGVPDGDAPEPEAGVVALKTRSIEPAEAVRQSLGALDWLRRQGAEQFLFKYCSTFDSTPQGNIGPVAEALGEALGAGIAVVCPVFPATGRTLYQGHLFVGDRLLSESGMEKHPLTPMTDPDIRRWLRHQTKGEVALVPYGVVRQGAEAIAAALAEAEAGGNRLAVVDAVTDDDLRAIGTAVAGATLVTGGSGIALGLPENFRRAGRLGGVGATFAGIEGPGAVLSGSCSRASRAQLTQHLARHPGLAVTAEAVLGGEITVAAARDFVLAHMGEAPAVYSTAEPEAVAAAQQRFGRERAAQALERFFGELAAALVAAGVTRLAVGGGETSGAVVAALGLDRLAIGPEIDPGVPALAGTAGGRPIRLALKSGNFGATDFYDKALSVMGTGRIGAAQNPRGPVRTERPGPRLSANLGFLWPDRPLLERIDAAARAGFRAIELHWPYDTPAAEVRARCERHGLKLLGINTVRGKGGENGLGALPGREAEFQAAVDQSVAYCVEAGGTAIHCMAGRVAPEEREEAARVFVENLREASDKAAPYGLTLLLEALNPHDAPGYFYARQAEAARILEAVSRPNVKLMFDVYHVGATEGDVLRRLARHLPVIGHVQIAAVPSRAEPDEGEIDYRAVFAELERLGYDGWIGAEYRPRGDTDAGLAWMRKLGVAA